jgi:hypothetical protein
MLKRFSFIIIITLIFSLCSISAFADNKDNSEGKDATKQVKPLITITHPDSGNENVFLKTYTICASTDSNHIRITLQKWNSTTEKYEDFANADGDSTWDVGTARFFAKDITLTIGLNKLRLLASDTTRPDIKEPPYYLSITLEKKKKTGILDIIDNLDKLNQFKKAEN